MKLQPLAFLAATCLNQLSSATPDVASPLTDPLWIPSRQDIVIDGDFGDWDKATFTELALFADNAGRAADPASHAAVIRLAWSETELLLAVDVQDDLISEANGSALWQGDALVTLLSPGKQGTDPVLFMLTPGIDKNGKSVAPRTLLNDYRKNESLKPIPPQPRFACQQTENGYRMEIAYPLNAYGLEKPKNGDYLRMQLEVKDRDDNDSVQPLEWNPLRNASHNPLAFNALKLSDSPDLRPSVFPKARLVDEQQAEILVYADPSLGGQQLTASFPNKTLQATLTQLPGKPYAVASFSAAYPQPNNKSWTFSITLNDQQIASFDFPDVTWVSSSNGYAPVPSLAVMLDFEKDRKQYDYSKDAILVIGSSTIRMWKSIQEDLAPWEIIHRGFGGSTIGEVLGAYQYLVEPYDVNRFLIYEGDTESLRGDQKYYLKNAREFIERINRDRPGSTIAFISPKPSPARAHLWDTNYREAREGIEQLVAEFPNVSLIDIAPALLDANGKAKEGIFLEDNVHLNERGYVFWTEAVRSHLEEIFGKPHRD